MFEFVAAIDQRNNIVALGYDHGSRQVSLRSGEKVEAHLGHHAEIALSKQPVYVRARAIVIFSPSLGVWESTHAGAHNLAIRKHHLHPAMRVEVVTKRAERVPYAMVQRIPDYTAPAGIGHIHPHLQLSVLDVPVQIEVGDPRFHDRKMPLVIHLDHAVHALQIEYHAPRKVWCGTPISQVLAR